MRRSSGLSALLLMFATGLSADRAAGQRQPPVAATVSTHAVGPAAPTAAPIGGLRTRPILPAAGHEPSGTGVTTRRGGSRLGGIVALAVADAPLVRGGVLVRPYDGTDDRRGIPADRQYRTEYWTPTAERPRWTQDSSVAPVQAWRDLIVTDVVCNPAATCLERHQRVRARWIAGCACYAFADALNRIWRVE